MSKPFKYRYAALIVIAAMLFSTGVRAQSAFEDPGARAAGGQGGDLKPVAEKTDAGAVAVGASAQVVVLFRNDDTKPIKTGIINLYPSSNITAAIGENQCANAAIAPGEICPISLQIKGLQRGNYRIEMLMRHDGRAKLLTTTISGTVESSGDETTNLDSDIEAIPDAVDFGDLDESSTQVRALVLRNKTSRPIKIKELKIEASEQSGFTMNSNCGELVTGAACVASITWTPQQKGPSTGTLIVRHDGATELATVELTGTFTPAAAAKADIFPDAMPGKGLLVSSQEDIDFGSGISQSASITVSLVNVGDVPLTLRDIRMTNSENGIRAEKSGCRTGLVLTPLEACPLTLTWEPVREGSIIDDLQVLHTGARGVLVMPLRGNAAAPVNKDKKAIMLGDNRNMDALIDNIEPLSIEDIAGDEDEAAEASDSKTGKSKTKSSDAEDDEAADADAKDKSKRTDSDGNYYADGQKRSRSSGYLPSQTDVRGLLDGYVITSYSPRRAIINGPGGSRVVFDGEQTVIGGVLWQITMRPSAIEFGHGDQKVLLLFDKSLSSINVLDAQSSSGAESSSSSGTATSTTSSSTTTTQ